MDARAMQDTDGSSSCANDIKALFDNSADFTKQSVSSNIWDTLDDSSTSSFAHSRAASASLQTQSMTGRSPDSHASAELPSESGNLSHKHNITRKSAPKKRRCSEESRTSRGIQDPSALDCSDYWLRFDSDEEGFGRLFESSPQDTKHVGSFCLTTTCSGRNRADDGFPLNLAESFADARVRSLSPSRRFSKTSRAGTPGDAQNAVLRPMTCDLIEDSALEEALSDDDDDLFPINLAPELGKATMRTPVPPPEEERLYSTPLSWEPPRPGYHMNYTNTNMPLSDAERQRLLAIALGTGHTQTQQPTRPPSVAEFRFEMPHSRANPTRNSPERKGSATATRPPAPANSSNMGERTREKPKNGERTAHNDIERKYRTNLKDKISELRDAIPSLRAIPEDDDANAPAGSSRTAPKVSKGTVLTKATEYIRQLERRNRSASHKNEELSRRLQAFEQLVSAAPGSTWRPQGYGGPVYTQRY
ncbi:helix-loop-helix DNA-binding domain-containing protein [Xylaria intraflava]|nr:helix-loop-helix DNA-binding domain-containing protein [Xylaria intraflava]